MTDYRCESCAAALREDDKFCPYCGLQVRRKGETKSTKTVEDIDVQLSKAAKNIENDIKGLKFNVLLFIILLIFCFPVAIVYAVITLVVNEDNKDAK